MILLTAVGHLVRVITSASGSIDCHADFVDLVTGPAVTPQTPVNTAIATATTTTVVTGPSSGQRTVQNLSIRNAHASTANTVTVTHYDGTTTVTLIKVTLAAGEALHYGEGGWKVFDVNGNIKTSQGVAAAGVDKSVQFNDGGSTIGADSGLTFDKATKVLAVPGPNGSIQVGPLTVPTTGMPATSPADTMAIFTRKVANRNFLSFVGPSLLDTTVQPNMARNKVGLWLPPGNAATVPGVFGITALTAQGTATSRTVAATRLATRMRRLGYPTSAATAGLFIGARMPVAQFSAGSGSQDGSGFFMVERWVEADPAPVSGRRVFTGMTASTAALTNVEYNTLLNVVGVIQLSTDATQWYSYAAGSAAQTAVALGTGLGAPGGNSTTAWELAIFAPSMVANTFYCQLTNLTTNVAVEWTVNGAATVCPQSSTLLAWNHGGTNNATALATGMDLCSLYFETDY